MLYLINKWGREQDSWFFREFLDIHTVSFGSHQSRQKMSELSIKVNIASRFYPLSIKPEEEENVRKAAKMINENIKNFEENYAVKDKQDLLAMAALEYASKILEKKSATGDDDKSLARLKAMDTFLADYLSKAQV